MTCAAVTYSDGSWFCKDCDVGGDKDEAVEDYCRFRKLDGMTAFNKALKRLDDASGCRPVPAWNRSPTDNGAG